VIVPNSTTLLGSCSNYSISFEIKQTSHLCTETSGKQCGSNRHHKDLPFFVGLEADCSATQRNDAALKSRKLAHIREVSRKFLTKELLEQQTGWAEQDPLPSPKTVRGEHVIPLERTKMRSCLSSTKTPRYVHKAGDGANNNSKESQEASSSWAIRLFVVTVNVCDLTTRFMYLRPGESCLRGV